MKKRLLYFVQFPPPAHGAAVVSAHVMDLWVLKDQLDSRVLPIRFARSIEDFRRLTLRKLGYAFWLAVCLSKQLLVFRPTYVYFTISPSGLAFFRDAIYVAVIKLFGATPIFNIHGRGIAAHCARSTLRR
ncbi:MAG: hypothetical protein MI755_16120 [Sphingomonadales bacterium]|nr:hypothetical protein [Sphingomonadales bacterium]